MRWAFNIFIAALAVWALQPTAVQAQSTGPCAFERDAEAAANMIGTRVHVYADAKGQQNTQKGEQQNIDAMHVVPLGACNPWEIVILSCENAVLGNCTQYTPTEISFTALPGVYQVVEVDPAQAPELELVGPQTITGNQFNLLWFQPAEYTIVATAYHPATGEVTATIDVDVVGPTITELTINDSGPPVYDENNNTLEYGPISATYECVAPTGMTVICGFVQLVSVQDVRIGAASVAGEAYSCAQETGTQGGPPTNLDGVQVGSNSPFYQTATDGPQQVVWDESEIIEIGDKPDIYVVPTEIITGTNIQVTWVQYSSSMTAQLYPAYVYVAGATGPVTESYVTMLGTANGSGIPWSYSAVAIQNAQGQVWTLAQANAGQLDIPAAMSWMPPTWSGILPSVEFPDVTTANCQFGIIIMSKPSANRPHS